DGACCAAHLSGSETSRPTVTCPAGRLSTILELLLPLIPLQHAAGPFGTLVLTDDGTKVCTICCPTKRLILLTSVHHPAAMRHLSSWLWSRVFISSVRNPWLHRWQMRRPWLLRRCVLDALCTRFTIGSKHRFAARSRR